jgi:hypothetical protein
LKHMQGVISRHLEGQCVICGGFYQKKQPNQLYCSNACRKIAYGRVGYIPISSASVGSISEMEVCCEMLRRGYCVFRAVSPSGFSDVVAIKGDEILMLEVRTGYRGNGGTLSYPKGIHASSTKPTHYAVYIQRTNEIVLVPITRHHLDTYTVYKGSKVRPDSQISY